MGFFFLQHISFMLQTSQSGVHKQWYSAGSFFFSVSQQGHTTQVLGNLMVCSNFQVTFSWTWTWSQTSDSLSSMHLIGPDLKIQDGCLINQRLRKFSTVFLLLLLSYLCLIKGVLQEATFFFCFMLFVFLCIKILRHEFSINWFCKQQLTISNRLMFQLLVPVRSQLRLDVVPSSDFQLPTSEECTFIPVNRALLASCCTEQFQRGPVSITVSTL